MANQNRNPRNPRSELFKSLTRIFSGPLVSRRTQTGRRLRRHQLDKHSSQFRSASGQSFKKTRSYDAHNLQLGLMNQHNRTERYTDFDQMEYTPEIASALDIYADEMTTHSSLQPMLNIQCSNEEIKAVLDSLYHNILNVEHNLFGWCRTMCKYGDFFLYLDVDEKFGIKTGIGLPSHEVERLEGEDKTNPEGFARMVKELERMDSAIKDKEDAERVLKKFEGNTGGLVSKNYANHVTIVDNRRNK